MSDDQKAPDCPPWSNEALDAAHAAYLDLLVRANGGEPIIRDYPSEMLVVETILSAVAEALDRARYDGAQAAGRAIEELRNARGVTPYWADDESLRLAARSARGAVPAPTQGDGG